MDSSSVRASARLTARFSSRFLRFFSSSASTSAFVLPLPSMPNVQGGERGPSRGEERSKNLTFPCFGWQLSLRAFQLAQTQFVRLRFASLKHSNRPGSAISTLWRYLLPRCGVSPVKWGNLSLPKTFRPVKDAPPRETRQSKTAQHCQHAPHCSAVARRLVRVGVLAVAPSLRRPADKDRNGARVPFPSHGCNTRTQDC